MRGNYTGLQTDFKAENLGAYWFGFIPIAWF